MKRENKINYYDDYDWERETWDALTDGMYGDYPEGGFDMEAIEVCLGLD